MDELLAPATGIVSNTGLGKLKLEGIYKQAIFLAPKCYVLKDLNGKITYKVKGLMKSVNISFKDFEALLTKDVKLLKNQDKWFKSLSEGNIKILEQLYTLRVTDNKRKLEFNENNNLVKTIPFNISNSGKIIK